MFKHRIALALAALAIAFASPASAQTNRSVFDSEQINGFEGLCRRHSKSRGYGGPMTAVLRSDHALIRIISSFEVLRG
jgi:hypothetical protein